MFSSKYGIKIIRYYYHFVRELVFTNNFWWKINSAWNIRWHIRWGDVEINSARTDWQDSAQSTKRRAHAEALTHITTGTSNRCVQCRGEGQHWDSKYTTAWHVIISKWLTDRQKWLIDRTSKHSTAHCPWQDRVIVELHDRQTVRETLSERAEEGLLFSGSVSEAQLNILSIAHSFCVLHCASN